MRLYRIILVVLLSLAGTCVALRPLANENLRGRWARGLNQVLRLEPDEIDIATATLIISEQWSELVHGRRHLAMLDDMAYELRKRIENERLTGRPAAVNIINQYLFDELDFSSVKDADDPEDLFLHNVLDENRGYCLSLSILYLSIGERLGMPLHGVVVPGHFFVRYDDGNIRFNIETTNNGAICDDNYYINEHNITSDLDDTIYLKNLNKQQTLGCFFNNLGICYMHIDNLDKSRLALERSIEINPSLVESRLNLGSVYNQLRMYDEAVDQYNYALSINPNDAKIYNNLGNTYLSQNKSGKAIEVLRASINLDGTSQEAYRNMAIAYYMEDMYELAKQMVRNAMKIEGKSSRDHVLMGKIYLAEGNVKQAIREYEKARMLDDNNSEAHTGLGMCFQKLKLSESALDAFKKALEVQPNDINALLGLANEYFSQRKYEKAIQYYRIASKLLPEDHTIFFNIGVAYSNMEEFEASKTALQQAIQLEPGSGITHSRLAYVLYHLKEYPEAKKHMDKAAALGEPVEEGLRKAILARQ